MMNKLHNKIYYIILLFFIFNINSHIISYESEILLPNTNNKDILSDCPWRIGPGQTTIPVMIIVKDAGTNVADYDLERVNVKYNGQQIYTYRFNKRITDNQYNLYQKGDWYGMIYVPIDGLPKNDRFKLEIKMEEDGEWYDPDGDTEDNIYCYISDYEPPSLPGWYSGDVHYHSHYTDNEYEFGGPLAPTREAAMAIGLDFVTVTDHSLDMSGTKFNSLINACDTLTDTDFIFLPAEEVSAKNYDGHYLHTLVYNQLSHIKGCEIDGLGYNREGYYIYEIINTILRDSAFIYIAHPEIGQFRWEVSGFGWGIDRGTTEDEDYLTPGLHGLQIWNTRRSLENWFGHLNTGLTKWKGLLAQGRRIFISAGSDSHGDFSYSRLFTQSSYPDWESDYPNALGRVKSFVYTGNAFTRSAIFEALKNGRVILTDGPISPFSVVQNNDTLRIGDNGLVYSDSAKLLIELASSPEFGKFDSLILYQGHVFDSNQSISDYYEKKYQFSIEPFYTDTTSIDLNQFLIPGKKYYYRLEANTDKYFYNVSYRTYTNPVWLERIFLDRTALIPEVRSSNDTVFLNFNLSSEYWKSLYTFQVNQTNHKSILLDSSVSLISGPFQQSFANFSDTVAPASAKSFKIKNIPVSNWYTDSVLTFSWIAGDDPDDSVYLFTNGTDQTGYNYNLIANSGFEIYDTASYSNPAFIEIQSGKLINSPLAAHSGSKCAAFTTANTGPQTTIRLESNQRYYFSCYVKNTFKQDSILIGLYLDNEVIFTDSINYYQDWSEIGYLSPVSFQEKEYTLQWKVLSEISTDTIYFDDLKVSETNQIIIPRENLNYHVKGFSIQNTTVFDSTTQPPANSDTIEYQVKINQDYKLISFVLLTKDQNNNQARQSQAIYYKNIDITPPQIDSFYWETIKTTDSAETVLLKFQDQQDWILLGKNDSIQVNAVISDLSSGLDSDSVILEVSGKMDTTLLMNQNASYFYSKLFPDSGWAVEKLDSLVFQARSKDIVGNTGVSEEYKLYIYAKNQAPELISYFPEDSVIDVQFFDTVTMNIEYFDPDNDSLIYSWFIFDSLVENNNSPRFSLIIDTVFQNDLVIKVEVTDKIATAYHYWKIQIDMNSLKDLTQKPNQPLQIERIYPNPANDHIFIKLNHEPRNRISYKIHNLLGETVAGQTDFSLKGNILKIDVKSFPTAHYIIELSTQDQKITSRFTKIK